MLADTPQGTARHPHNARFTRTGNAKKGRERTSAVKQVALFVGVCRQL
jgi:hypothetical protein